MLAGMRKGLFKVETEELAWPSMTPLQAMASNLWVLMAFMGVSISLIALAFSGFNADFTADMFAFPKAVREGARPDLIDQQTMAALMDKQVFVETTKVWVDGFMFLGMGFLLAAITMLLASILGNLRLTGAEVQQAAGRRMLSLKPPWTAKFPFLMLTGLLVLAAHLGFKVALAILAHGVFKHAVAEIDGAAVGSALLTNFQTLQTYLTWLDPFKFVGLAVMLVGISLALYTIVRALRFQNERIQAMAEGAG